MIVEAGGRKIPRNDLLLTFLFKLLHLQSTRLAPDKENHDSSPF